MQASAFRPEDLDILSARGIPVEEAERQLDYLRNPPPAIVLDRPAAIGDGIERLDGQALESAIASGRAAAASGRVMKFVPASGAASRMFAGLIAALDGDDRPSASPDARRLFERLDRFPFAAELRELSGIPGEPRTAEEERTILDTLLNRMRYAQLPKALIPFHDAGRRRTAFEEQLLEAARFARADDGTCRIHFTVAPEARHAFEALLEAVRPDVERARQCRLDVGFSEQHPSTDTLALDADRRPFRLADDTLLFRPGGHGALITNLASLGGDIVVIKNVDNILPDEASAEVIRWKHALIGVLVTFQAETFQVLAACAADQADDDALDRGMTLAASRFARQPGASLRTPEDKRRFLVEALDRPVRVCGVVRNEGEPGGAPFWVREPRGRTSMQIVEASQVDAADPAQARVFQASTHFNPVDIVCGLRSWQGTPYDLARFVDPSAVFIAQKTHDGRALRALERPGLWNGGMAGWNTICVEVPASTFAPVKTVFDLLRPQHQPPRG